MNQRFIKALIPAVLTAVIVVTAVCGAGCISSPDNLPAAPNWFNSDVISPEAYSAEGAASTDSFTYTDNFYNAVNEAYIRQMIESLSSAEAAKGSQETVETPETGELPFDTQTLVDLLVTMATQMNTPLGKAQLEIPVQLQEIAKDTTLQGYEAKLIREFSAASGNMEKRDADGVNPVLPYIEEIKAVSSLDELTELIGTGGSASLKEVFIREEVTGLLDDAAKTAVYLHPGKFTLGDAALYKSMTPETQAKYEKIKTIFKNYLIKCGYTEKEAADTAEAFGRLETEIAQVCYPKDAEYLMPDYYEKINNPAAYEELQAMKFPAAADQAIYHDAGVERFVVTNPEWLDLLNSLYTEENLEGFRAMLLFSLCTASINLLDSESQNMPLDLMTSTSLSDIASANPFLSDPSTEYLGMAYGKYYAQKYTTPEMKEDLTKLIHQIVDVYMERLSKTTWISDETRKNAEAKLENLKIRVLYPDDWSYYTYDDVDFDDCDSLLDYTVELRKHNQNRLVKDAQNDPSENIWPVILQEGAEILPQTINAYYNPADNSINILAGFVNACYNPANESYEEMLAGVGTTIGHEISHGFDPLGSKFDKDGTYRNWWTEADHAAFEKKVDKVDKFFSRFEAMPGVYLPGEQYTGEAIADMGGMSVILDIASDIPDFDYQKFFIKYGKVFYSPYVTDLYRNTILKDVHPPGMYRVNVTVQQFDEFMNAFGVTETDNMYLSPDHRITVW